MAILKKHSYDPKKIKRYKFYNGEPVIELKTEKDYTSYLESVKKNVCFDYDGTNCIVLRIRSDIVLSSGRVKWINFLKKTIRFKWIN